MSQGIATTVTPSMARPAVSAHLVHDLDWPTVVGWSVGTIGPVTILYVVNYAFMFFMTDVLRMSAAIAGSLIFASRRPITSRTPRGIPRWAASGQFPHAYHGVPLRNIDHDVCCRSSPMPRSMLVTVRPAHRHRQELCHKRTGAVPAVPRAWDTHLTHCRGKLNDLFFFSAPGVEQRLEFVERTGQRGG